MKKRLSLLVSLVLFCSTTLAGNKTVAWDYDFNSSPDVVAFRVYAVPGENTAWLPGNVNATKISNVTTGSMTGVVTNIQGTLVGLATGKWTVTVVALTAAGITSDNADSITVTVGPEKPTNLR